MRFTVDTPDPEWIKAFDVKLEDRGARLMQTPLIREAQRGPDGLDLAAMREFLKQFRVCVIEPFYGWEILMLNRVSAQMKNFGADVCVLLQDFLAANAREEQFHDVWWTRFAGFWGVKPEEFGTVEINPIVAELTHFVTEIAEKGSLVHAVLVVNYFIETVAARLTAAVMPHLVRGMTSKQAQWPKVHCSGDPNHARDARELLKRMVGPDEDLEVLAAMLTVAADLFEAAILAAYQRPAGSAPIAAAGAA